MEADGGGGRRTGMPSFRVDGTVALITGSSRGIGLAIARGLALSGAQVILNGRDEQALIAARAALEEAGAEPQSVHHRVFDVTDEGEVERAVADVEFQVGPIGILVNNAGIQRRVDLTELPLEQWREVLEVNLTAAFLVGRTVAKRMVPRGSGKILNTCSVQTDLVRANTGAYASSKGGLGNLTKAMCAEWARFGLQVNGLAPGYIATQLTAALTEDPAFSSWLLERTPARRWGSVDDLIGPAVWLCSEASNFVNGQVVYVDGGITAVM